MGWYSKLVTHYPVVFIVFDVVLVGVCGPLALWFHGVPSFDDPRKGFETRGTPIRGRSQAALELQRQLWNGNLTVIPGVPEHPPLDAVSRNRRDVKAESNMSCLSEPIIFDLENKIPRMAVQATTKDANLLDVAHLKAICNIEDKYISPHFVGNCRGHSLPYYIAETNNKTCNDLTTEDVNNTINVLKLCSAYFYNETLKNCYLNEECSGLPVQCFRHNVVYKILNYLTDINFLTDGDTAGELKVTYSQIIFRPSWLDPTKDLSDVRDYYVDNLDNVHIISDDGLVESKSMDLLIKIQIFNNYVISDLPFYGLAMSLVLIAIVLYMRSFILTMVILVVVVFTILTGYFFYAMVFRFPFFPFINVLAGLLCIAVGADDVFILFDIWNSFVYDQDGKKNEVEKIASLTLTHGAVSILVTSLTTAAALFANYVSDITSLKCFSMFAGICIMLNFFFMITFVPPILVLMARSNLLSCCRCECKKLTNISNKFWNKYLPMIIIKARYFWVLIFLSIGISGIIIVFIKPKLTLPTSAEMQVFYPEHHFEKYRNEMTDKFRYELELRNVLQYNVYIQFVWGVDSSDKGSELDPQDNGTILFHENYNIYAKSSQLQNRELCLHLLDQNFILEPEKHACFFDVFSEIVREPCNSTGIQIHPCCDLSYPLEEKLAEICLQNIHILTSMTLLAESQKKEIVGFPIYDNLGQSIKTFMLVIPTTYKWTTLYDITDDFYSKVERFVQEEKEHVSTELQDFWWCGARHDFFYYDLQKSLAGGTLIGIGVSLAVGCFVLLLTSMNFLITIYSIVTIALIIATTVGILVLLGWELGFFESITITLAVGLSIDFTIHYGVAYLLDVGSTRALRVSNAMSKVGSAVAMATFTTFLAGAAVMGGRVLGYRNFGVFLMIVMTVSWSFSTFFFLSLCALIGPLGKCGDIRYLFHCVRRSNKLKIDKEKSNGETVRTCTNNSVTIGDVKNSFVKSKITHTRQTYFQSLNDTDQYKLKEMARPSRLANHNMNSNESIFDSKQNDNTGAVKPAFESVISSDSADSASSSTELVLSGTKTFDIHLVEDNLLY